NSVSRERSQDIQPFRHATMLAIGSSVAGNESAGHKLSQAAQAHRLLENVFIFIAFHAALASRQWSFRISVHASARGHPATHGVLFLLVLDFADCILGGH